MWGLVGALDEVADVDDVAFPSDALQNGAEIVDAVCRTTEQVISVGCLDATGEGRRGWEKGTGGGTERQA